MKDQLGYLCGVTINDRGYRHFYLEIKVGYKLDLAEEFKKSGDEYYLDLLRRVRKITRGTVVFHIPLLSGGIELDWMSHRLDDGTWAPMYGCQVMHMPLCHANVDLLSRVMRRVGRDCGEDIRPSMVIRALHRIGARRITYPEGDVGYGNALFCDISDEDIDRLEQEVPELDSVTA